MPRYGDKGESKPQNPENNPNFSTGIPHILDKSNPKP
jgi:hypothetical protein